MGSMSWSDDTRCLYCEGKLPLYRKVTHGQFCSSAHRKAYWQEQERLAVERLQETHLTLNSIRVPVAQESAELPQLKAALLPPLVVRTQLSIPAAHQAESFAPAVPGLSGILAVQLAPTTGQSTQLMVADPIEYEIASQPLPPSPVWSSPGTKSLPQGTALDARSYVASRQWTSQAAWQHDAEPFEGVLCHPKSTASALELSAGGAVSMPLLRGGEFGQTARRMCAAVEPIEAKPTPATHLVLEVAPQNDVLVQLLDQQVPHPDQLLALARFAAQEQPFAFAAKLQEKVDFPAETILPTAAAVDVAAPDYQLAATQMRQLSAAIAPKPGSFAARTEIAEISVNPSTSIATAAIPAIADSTYQLGVARLQSLPTGLIAPAEGIFASCTGGPQAAFEASAGVALPSAFAGVTTLAPRFAGTRPLPSEKVAPSPGTIASYAPLGPEAALVAVALPGVSTANVPAPRVAGTLSLPSAMVVPSPGILASQTAASNFDLDLSSAVSADLALPGYSQKTTNAAGPAPQATGFLPLPFGHQLTLGGETPRPEPIGRLIPQTADVHPIIPGSRLEPMDRKPDADALRTKGTGSGFRVPGYGLEKLEPAWAHATGFWQHAPRDLKLLMFAIPALLALVFHPGLPRVASAAPPSAASFPARVTRAVSDQFVNVRQTLENRAAIALDEDFRSGLDNWVSPGGSTTEWSFDQTGFVQPGPLALYRPSVMLADYQLQFMGLIDKKALSWVVRASDFQNFYVIKLEVTKSGPLPAIGLTRYAVINGQATDRHDVNIPLSARPDTLYAVRMDVRGSNFSVEVQGQMADSWTETRLKQGGIGFFTARGEASRVRWVQITHQYDMLGRLCAYLAPYDTSNGSWQP
jgi:hypothetical protein